MLNLSISWTNGDQRANTYTTFHIAVNCVKTNGDAERIAIKVAINLSQKHVSNE